MSSTTPKPRSSSGSGTRGPARSGSTITSTLPLSSRGSASSPSRPLPTRATRKAASFRLVKFVKGAFFQARRFRNRADLLAQLADWLHYTNEERPCDATGVTPAARLVVERPHLRPLPFG